MVKPTTGKILLSLGVLAALATLFALVSQAYSQSDSCTSNINENTTVSGNLTPDCTSSNRRGNYAKFYTLSLDSQANLTITLESTAFDTYLFLMQGSGQNGTVETENDDFNGSREMSQITANLSPGQYTIEATAYGVNKGGAFSLTVSGLPDTTEPTPQPSPGPTNTPAPGASPTPEPTVTPTGEPVPTEDVSLPSVIERVRPEVVKITHGGGRGSGVIIRTEGNLAWAITNQHVVDNVINVNVFIRDTERQAGTVIGADVVRDLAVVRFSCTDCQVATFSDSRILEVGERVFAVGYPRDSVQPVLEEPPERVIVPGIATVTQGSISAFRYDSGDDVEYIQTDAPINPGNSGGPLYTSDGLLVGINTWKLRESEGLAYSILETTVQEQLATLMSGVSAPTIRPLEPVVLRKVLVGPLSGHFHHDPTRIGSVFTGLIEDDLTIGAFFTNPYSSALADFSFGFYVRETSLDTLVFAVKSPGEWQIRKRFNNGTPSIILASGVTDALWLQDRYRNYLAVSVIGDHASFSINGKVLIDSNGNNTFFVGPGSGRLHVIDGYFTGTAVPGAITFYDGLRVWETSIVYVGSTSSTSEAVYRAWEEADFGYFDHPDHP